MAEGIDLLIIWVPSPNLSTELFRKCTLWNYDQTFTIGWRI